MKNLLTLIGLLTVILSTISATVYITKNNNNLAEVNRMQGVYIFTDSEPVQDYEHLGTVNISEWVVMSSQYTAKRNLLIKKTLKKFPKADGIILHLYDGGTDKADAIIFKD
ncbi:MAG: hypothetical protein ACRBFS_24280 [Aureispira sp.]